MPAELVTALADLASSNYELAAAIRVSRSKTWMAGVLLILVLAVGGFGGYQTYEIRKAQHSNASLLKLVTGVAGPDAQKAGEAQTKCLINRLDHDTIGTATDPICITLLP